MRALRAVWYPIVLGIASVKAQNCENYGTPDGSNCSCPTGFGGPTCSSVACGGTIFQGSQRPLTPPSSGFANLTSAGCSCQDGWTGTGCNVCTSSSSCIDPTASLGGQSTGVSDPMVCNTAPRVYAAGHMSCDVNNPTLQALYPRKSTLNIMRTRQPSLTPLPGVTAFGDPETVFAQLFYDGVEQFYCHADTCSQEVNDSDGSASWHCNDLKCTCRPGSSFCGGVPMTDLTSPINGLVGTLDIECSAVNASTNSGSCRFIQQTLQQLFGPDGLPLDGCKFGECVRQSVIDSGGNLTDTGTNATGTTGPGLSSGVIAGLAVVGGLVLLALLTLIWGLWLQRKARFSGLKDIDRRRVALEWVNLTYIVPSSHGRPPLKWIGLRESGEHDEKTILDALTGRVDPGQMMAILGPSGAGKTTLVEILAGKSKSGVISGQVLTPAGNDIQGTPRIGFVPQQDILPPMLTVFEALLFAARLKLPESVPDTEKRERVDALLQKLGIEGIRNTRIGDNTGGKARGISGGEMRRVSIGAGKTTLVEILAGKSKSGVVSGQVLTPAGDDIQGTPRIGFVPQQDILPPMLTVFEALLFAARLKLPESVPDTEKRERVDALLQKLGIEGIRNTRIGDNTGGKARGISGGEMRRVSIGLELIASPDVLILDEPTSGLDSVSAARVASLLREIAHDPVNPIPVIASIHQPSSQLYQRFDTILVLSQGHALYSGLGSMAPIYHFRTNAANVAPPYPEGYNVADYLLEVASDPPVGLFDLSPPNRQRRSGSHETTDKEHNILQKEGGSQRSADGLPAGLNGTPADRSRRRSNYATTFLTQFQYLSGREWKILRRDKSLFITHLAVACVLGVFCGGLYYQTDETIAGFQSRVGCLFFLGALIAFSSLSALYNIVEIRPLFLRERSSAYYSPTAWLLSRFFFDMIPLRLIPTIIVSTVTYWMAGLAHHPANFFKFLFVLVLYSMAMTLFNFFLGTLFQNGGIAILLSALTALYQMTFAGFFVHLNSIPPVLRWLQWLCPLKYCLEALSVNEVGSGLMIVDKLQGVPVNISANLIMNTLFGFGSGNYYRDILVLFAFIAGFGLGVIGIVWLKVRERR
ncbi:ATP-binding cassette sub-family G member 2 [Leucoagaricus sp. SymC.cos]|nr:ATP-binding cassette sub-family G member 2 [Leucoagaricus sp. SymC.cos]